MSTIADLPVYEPVTEENMQVFTAVDPSCPVCGGRITDTYEDVPDKLDSHFVYGTCEDCDLHLTIEYRAIDVSFRTEQGTRVDFHSGVSHGLINPTEREYVERSEYHEFPTPEELRSIDWPIECDGCDNSLPVNNIEEVTTDSEPTTATLTCAICDTDNEIELDPDTP